MRCVVQPGLDESAPPEAQWASLKEIWTERQPWVEGTLSDLDADGQESLGQRIDKLKIVRLC